MFRMSFANLVARKLRLLTTTLAIILGVAFTAGTMILADTMTASFGTAIEQLSDGVDTVVRGEQIGDTDTATPRQPVPLAEIDALRSIDGVAAVAPYWEGYAQVIGADGKALDIPQSVGLNWIDDAELSMFELVDGRAPAEPGEIVLGDTTANEAGVGVGERVDVITAAGRETFIVAGLSQFDGGAELGSTAFTFFHETQAGEQLGSPTEVARLLVRGDRMFDETTLTDAVAARFPGYDVASGTEISDEMQDDLGDVIGVFETILLVFGGIALFVGSFTIANTFTITVAQRTKELALVRAIGASRRQVLGSVVAEALALGIIAAGLGLAAGVGVAKGLTAVFAAAGLEFPARALVIEPSTAVTALLTGVLVTVAAALIPARRAASVAPVDAMRSAAIESTSSSRRRKTVGATLTAVGGAVFVLGIMGASAALVGLGAVTLFLASIALGPMLLKPVAATIAVPMRRLGASGRLAAANATRNPKRSAATAAALTIGVMLVAGASMFASTARETILGDVTTVVTSDRVVRPVGANPGIPTTVAADLASVPGLTVAPMQVVDADVDGSYETVAGIDLDVASSMTQLEVVDGTLGAGATVGDRLAEDRGWGLGDTMTVSFPDGIQVDVTISAIVEQTTAFPSIITPYGTVAGHGDGLDRMVLVAGDEAALAAAETAIGGAPTAVVDTVEGYAASLAGPLDAILTMVIGFLGLAVVIAVLGIATTVGLSVHERTRELGVLRAVGMSRRQLRRSIRLESITIALFGTILGMVMGLGFTAAVLSTLSDDGFVAPVVPVATLVVVAVGAVIAGTMAAALPARRASKMAVLDAVRTA
jgi:putative ABC transport system permease protein